VVPAGAVWQAALAGHPTLPLYDKDGSHPSPLGSYLAACVFTATLFGEKSVGLAVPARLKLSPELARLVQEAIANQIEHERS
jgi:hypothetical protein